MDTASKTSENMDKKLYKSAALPTELRRQQRKRPAFSCITPSMRGDRRDRSRSWNPKLRPHKSGHFYVRLPQFLGLPEKSKWFGNDPVVAEQRLNQFIETQVQLVKTDSWRGIRGGMEPASPFNGHPLPTGQPGGHFVNAPAAGLAVMAVAQKLFDSVDADGGAENRLKDTKQRLKKFTALFGARPLDSLGPDDFVAFKKSLKGQAPNWINVQLSSARRLLKFAGDFGYSDKVFRVAALKNVGGNPLPDKAISPENLKILLPAVHAVNPDLAKALYCQFLGVMRPSELVTVLHKLKDYQENANGTVSFTGKTTHKTKERRSVILTDLCRDILNKINRFDHIGQLKLPNRFAYRHRCWIVGRKLCELHGADFIKKLTGKAEFAPHAMRHSSIDCLIQAGVAEEFVRVAAGRLKAKVDRAYSKAENWEQARKAIGVLSKIVPPSTVGL